MLCSTAHLLCSDQIKLCALPELEEGMLLLRPNLELRLYLLGSFLRVAAVGRAIQHADC